MLDISANKEGTKVNLVDMDGNGNGTSTNEGPNVNVLNANVGEFYVKGVLRK